MYGQEGIYARYGVKQDHVTSTYSEYSSGGNAHVGFVVGQDGLSVGGMHGCLSHSDSQSIQVALCTGEVVSVCDLNAAAALNLRSLSWFYKPETNFREMSRDVVALYRIGAGVLNTVSESHKRKYGGVNSAYLGEQGSNAAQERDAEKASVPAKDAEHAQGAAKATRAGEEGSKTKSDPVVPAQEREAVGQQINRRMTRGQVWQTTGIVIKDVCDQHWISQHPEAARVLENPSSVDHNDLRLI